MDNIETTTKRGRPAATINETNQRSQRNAVALSVLSGVIAAGHEVTNTHELARWCYRMADAFIEVGDE